MAQGRPSKRARVGGSYRDSIPFQDDFSIVHAREGRLRRVSNNVRTAPTERLPQHDIDHAWNSASNWLPIDDPEYALEPDGEWYDDALEADVMDPPIRVDALSSTAQKKKRIRSNLSVCLCPFSLVIWFLIFCRKGLMSYGRTSTAKRTWRRFSDGPEGVIFVLPWNVQIVWDEGAQWRGCRNIDVGSALSLTSFARPAV
jgi:hypothetical protein